MSLYSVKTYSTFVYGPDPSTVTLVSPDSGPSVGGESIVIEGTGFDPRHWDDLFTGVLDPLKWTNISAGTGTVTTGASHLQLSTGATAASTAGVASTAAWLDCQLELRVILPRIAANPAGTVTPIAFQLRVDATNYALMSISLSTAGVYTLTCAVYRAGVLKGSYSETVTRGLSNLRILRWGTTVYFIYNGTVVYYNADFVTTVATFRIYNSNAAIAYDTLATVEWFYWRTFFTIDDQIIHAPTIVSDFRLRGFTPPSVDEKGVSAAYAGLSDVSVVGTGAVTSNDSYLYYYNDRLRVLNVPQFSTVLSVIDDDQLLTKSTSAKGL
jgi:hypothetical protein